MLGERAVATGCLGSLNGKREGNWDDEVTNMLNRDYEDWRDPEKTYMVPCELSYSSQDDGEKAEKKVFDLLQSFGESQSEGMFVIHSYNFAEMISEWSKKSNRIEKKWLTGEHDFVVLHPKCGFIFFQVKAAVRTKEKFSEANKQLLKDRQSLQAFVAKEAKGRKKKDINHELFTYPGFVVMPNCPRPDDSVVIPSNGVFKEHCESVEAFSKWWEDNVKREMDVNKKLFEILVMRFVGMSHSLPCTLSESIEENKKVMEMCTEKQLLIILSSASEQWITGPAGSGKTWLLMKKVLMLAKDALFRETKEKILVVCYNRPLSKMFAKTFEDHLINLLQDGNLQEVITVKTFDSLLLEITGSELGKSDEEKAEHVSLALKRLEETGCAQQYDHIFVDECQDLCGVNWPTLFKRLLKNDDDGDDDDDDDDDDDRSFREPKHMWFLYDANQYVRLSEKQYRSHQQSIAKGYKLCTVFRNTGSIFDQSKKYYVGHSSVECIKLGHNIQGLEIKWDESLTMNRNDKEGAGARCIVKHIKSLQKNKVEGRDICILTRNVEIRDGISSELEKLGIESQNAEDLYLNFAPNKVVVESIRRFKGLESKVVVLYDPPFLQGKDWISRRTKELLYTAVSRCFCYLIVITTEYGGKALKSDEGISDQENKGPLAKRGIETCSKSGPSEFSPKRSKRS